MTPLDLKYDKYKKLIKEVQDKYGFVESHECDSLLWSGLVGCLSSISVDIDAAFNSKDGQWKRRPIVYPCYPDHSRSSISRDMLVGLAWYVWANKRSDIADQIVKYSISHFGIIGKAKDFIGLSRINIMPPLFVTFLLMSKWGRYFKWLDKLIPADFTNFSRKTNGYQAHLSVMHCLLRNRITNRNKYKNIFKYHADREPNNALFQYTAGRIDKARKLLCDPILFPPNRLPMRMDRKAVWLWQRDYGNDWKRADNNIEKIHSGGDLLFLYALMKGEF